MDIDVSKFADKVWYRNIMKKLASEQQANGNNDKNETKGDNDD